MATVDNIGGSLCETSLASIDLPAPEAPWYRSEQPCLSQERHDSISRQYVQSAEQSYCSCLVKGRTCQAENHLREPNRLREPHHWAFKLSE